MIDFKEISEDGEIWEQFSQEFLLTLGLAVESPPDRGPDGGKDLLMIEHVQGPLHRSSFRWLVSCKHHANSGTAVSENSHERNILERVHAFKANGFIGMYSTLPSSGLNGRLRQLVDSGDLAGYKIFSGKLVEAELMNLGRASLIQRYFPNSYRKLRPLHNILDAYIPLKCAECAKDLLEQLYSTQYGANILFSETLGDSEKKSEIVEVFWACKGGCDRTIEKRMWAEHKATTSWEDIGDISMPNKFIQWTVTVMNGLRGGQKYSDSAFDKLKEFLFAMSQKVLREVTEDERKRFADILRYCG